MLGVLSKSIAKIFGTKHDKDIKAVQHLVDSIHLEYDKLHNLTNDELRNKTIEFKNRINEATSEIDSSLTNLRLELKETEDSIKKEAILSNIDLKISQKDDLIEKILLELLPEAFAVVKQTAKRFTENEKLIVESTDLDIQLANKYPHIVIDQGKAIYYNKWNAAGNNVDWNMIHYDVQLIGGIALHQGKISEMSTGEGKTLVATLPVYLNALAGLGVHLVTVNDYLALRDSEWNAPIFNFLGLSVACIDTTPPNSQQRQNAYNSDITYGTNNEFGFDFLRDNMADFTDDLVQKKLHFAIVDETDSVLIDDARTPLIISGRVDQSDKDEKMFYELKPRINKLFDAQKQIVYNLFNDAKNKFKNGDISDSSGGLALLRAHRGLPKYQPLIKFLSEEGNRQILLKTEGRYLQDNQKEMPMVDSELLFTIEEKNNQVTLTDKGIEMITNNSEEKDFFVIPDLGTQTGLINKMDISDKEKFDLKVDLMNKFQMKSERLHIVTQLLKAYTLFDKDVHYVLMENKVKIVDENTGRIMEGRRYSDGLHQAIEAKENVKVEASSQTVATITLQNYFRMYHKLSGMTGTAETEASEFWEIYKLDVMTIPTNRKLQRKDRNDLIFKTKREKYNAIIEQISTWQNLGKPVLVGTTSVEISELLSKMLTIRKINHKVLNAKYHGKEAEIVAEAGKSGAVTIATNMAGRGTDIKIDDEVKSKGGLAIIGSERHESRRIDRQLRGRSGRQGDPGESVFYVSLEDDLMRIFGSDRIAKVMDTLGLKEGEVIENSMITSQIERAQKKVEENHFGMRKRLLEYDNVMNSQRDVIYKKRKNALYGERLNIDVENSLFAIIKDVVTYNKANNDFENFSLELIKYFKLNIDLSIDDFKSTDSDTLINKIFDVLNDIRKNKAKEIADSIFPAFENISKNQPGIINVIISITIGKEEKNVFCKLSDAIETKGKSIIRDIEKSLVLDTIDDKWTKHLREMDELKQSVQNAVWEQKDPIVIYKKEAYELFAKMIEDVNFTITHNIVNYNLKNENEFKASKQELHTNYNNMSTNSSQFESSENYGANEEDVLKPKKEPIRVENKVGRNDPCFCNSGKKFKNCHGKEE